MDTATAYDMGRMQLLLDSNRGIYIPRDWAEEIYPLSPTKPPEGAFWGWLGILASDVAVLLAGPDHEDYWETWDDVLDNAVYVNPNGSRWVLFQDGDLWAVMEGTEIDD
jgi:hypothetical protein